MGPFTNVFRSDGTMGLEHTVGNMRFDLMKPGESPSIVLNKSGNMSTVIKPNGQVVQEFQIGNMRHSSDQNRFDKLF